MSVTSEFSSPVSKHLAEIRLSHNQRLRRMSQHRVSAARCYSIRKIAPIEDDAVASWRQQPDLKLVLANTEIHYWIHIPGSRCQLWLLSGQMILHGLLLTCATLGTSSGTSYVKRVSKAMSDIVHLRHALTFTLTFTSPRSDNVGIRRLRPHRRHTQRRHQQLLLATHHLVRIHCRAIPSLRYARWRR